MVMNFSEIKSCYECILIVSIPNDLQLQASVCFFVRFKSRSSILTHFQISNRLETSGKYVVSITIQY